MKTKSILSSLILLVFAILGGGSFDSDGSLSAWVGIVILVFVIVIIASAINQSTIDDEKKKKREEVRIKREQELKEKRRQYEVLKQIFIGENGTPDKSIIIDELDFNSEIHAYESSKKVFILGKEYSFKDIISCTFSDNPRITKGKVTAITKSNTGDVIGRSIVGDVIGGSAGAIIGGTSAKKHTEYIQEDDKTIHDYTVIININSIADPIIRIHTGERGKLTNEIVGLMNVIISRK